MTRDGGGVEPGGPGPKAAGDAATAPPTGLDPRALRVAVALDRRLPGDESITVSPAPVPVRPLDSDLAETGLFGGIAHGLSAGTTHAGSTAASPTDDPATTAGLSTGPASVAHRPTDAREVDGREEPSREDPAREEPVREATTLIVDGRPRRVRLERIDTDHAILEYGAARPDGSAAERQSAPSPEEGTSTADRLTRVRVVLGPADRRRADGVLSQEVTVDGWRFELELESERRAALRDRARRGHEAAGHAGPMEIHAIIPGRIVAISVSAGDAVEAGQQLLVEEAMKMQNELRAPREGEIERIAVVIGQTVDVGDLLMVIS